MPTSECLMNSFSYECLWVCSSTASGMYLHLIRVTFINKHKHRHLLVQLLGIETDVLQSNSIHKHLQDLVQRKGIALGNGCDLLALL